MIDKKVALVTGVSSGIGRATAALLAGRGFRVFGSMRRPSETNGRLGDLELVRLDVRDEESVRSCLLTRFRSLAGSCLVLLLILLFPANIKAAREGVLLRGKPATRLWMRAPMQILFIVLTWWSTRS